MKPQSLFNRLSVLLRQLSLITTMFLGTASVPGQVVLTWDPIGNNGGGTNGTASGNWDPTPSTTVSNWWNGTTNVAWTQPSVTGGTNAAIFGGSDGTWNITNIAQVSTTNLVINNSGYSFYGSPLDIRTPGNMNLADGKSVTFYCNLPQDNNQKNYVIRHGSVMTVLGNILGQQPRFIGPPDSAFYFGGPNSAGPGVTYVLGPVYVTNGLFQSGASFFIGYRSGIAGPGAGTYSNGTFTVSSGATFTSGGSTLVGRGGGQGTLTLLDGGTINVDTIGSGQRDLQLTVDANSWESGILNVFGGTLNVGVVGSSTMVGTIKLLSGGSAPATTNTPGEVAILYQTNGVINAWGGITLGAASGNFKGGSALVTNSGGYLYLGPTGIKLGQVYGGTNIVSLSGGAVGALADWSSSLPLILDGLNGNITFLCADNFSSPHNITLTGPLTGPGGLNVAGPGVLTLSAANTYAGTTTLSNGTLVLNVPSTSLTNGAVTLDGAAGSPILSLQLSAGQGWNISGLTCQNGSATSDFQFGSLPPSIRVAPIQVAGNLNFASTPNITVEGSAIPVGIFPLIQYRGSMSGTPPTSATLPSNCSGYISNIVASKTIALVVTGSTIAPSLFWAGGDGTWDFTTANWTIGSPIVFTNGAEVVLDDTASGTSPITITLDSVVQPNSVNANNTLKNYIIAGTGSIIGPTSLSKQGVGTLTLDCANAYTGGTVLNAGQLNINNGGDSSGTNSAIGAGPLTLADGAAVDNTSGTNVVLKPTIPQTWNGDFTYIGSSNSLNTGPGAVTMTSSMTVTVNSNNLTIGGSITDNGKVFKLTKSGNGALTLPAANNFGGGLELFQGQINFGDPGAGGQGQFYIDGGAIDNISGGPLTVTFNGYQWAGSFTYVGSTTNVLTLANSGSPVGFAFGSITATVLGGAMEWDLDLGNGNQGVIKNGPGTLIMGGNGTTANQMGISVDEGVFEMARASGFAVANWAGSHKGLIVQSNALALDLGNGNPQIGHGAGIPVTLQSGGILDLNGNSETVDSLTLNGGILSNGNTNSSQSTLSIVYAGTAVTPAIILQGETNQINVAESSGLTLNALITGSGGFVMNGPGTLTLQGTNTYTGRTTIQSGTIALAQGGAITASSDIDLAATNAILDLYQSAAFDANGNPLLTLQNGQALSGFGVVNRGVIATTPGATLAPGSASTVGTLTVTGFGNDSNVLSGITMMKLNKAGQTNDQFVVQQGSLVLGGSLVLTNLSGTLAAGDSFTLFAAPGGISGSFASILPAWPAPGLLWNTNNLAVNGTISMVIAPLAIPARITSVSLSGGKLMVQGNNGVANGPYMVLETTNVALPRTDWIPVFAGTFDGFGSFSISITTTNAPAEFFTIAQP